MKKLLTLLLTLCLMAVPFASLAEEGEEMDLVLEGFVTEILDEGFVMEDTELGEMMLNTSETTVWDGLLADGELSVGQYVIVQYDGRTTFSLPPQAHADRVGCYVLDGIVAELLEDGFLLTGDETFGEAIIKTDAPLSEIYLNVPVQVYYDGVMTLSLPGQAAARHIVFPTLQGTVSELNDEGFTLTTEDGQAYLVLFGEMTQIGEILPEAEEEVILEDAAELAETDEEEVIEEEAAEEAMDDEAEIIELADGDQVTVHFNGAMTRSIPPQLTALEVLIHR